MRLASLRDSPLAFSATLEGALRRTDEEWRQGLRQRTQFVAEVGGAVAGTAGGIATPDAAAAELVSMWVAPDFRSRGIGGRLVEAVVEWARSAGFGEVRLWVAEDNIDAEHVYARLGFKRTGPMQPIREGEPRLEFEMTRAT